MVWPVNRAYGIITIIQNYFLSIITSVHRNKVSSKEFCSHLMNRIAFAGLLKIVLEEFSKVFKQIVRKIF